MPFGHNEREVDVAWGGLYLALGVIWLILVMSLGSWIGLWGVLLGTLITAAITAGVIYAIKKWS